MREACKLNGAGEPQPGIHRRCDEFSLLIRDRNLWANFRVVDHDVIATLGFKRKSIAKLRRQRPRERARGDNRSIGGDVTQRSADRLETSAVECKSCRCGSVNGGAVLDGLPRDVSQGHAGYSCGRWCVREYRRCNSMTGSVRIACKALASSSSHATPFRARKSQAARSLVYPSTERYTNRYVAVENLACVGGFHQRRKIIHRGTEHVLECARLCFDTVRTSCSDVARKPAGDVWQIGPAYRERAKRIS